MGDPDCSTQSGRVSDELASVLTAFEDTTGLQICFRPISDRWRGPDGLDPVPERFAEHRSAFCRATKSDSLSACVKCDHTALPIVCVSSDGPVTEPFVRACHAGAEEILLPLWSNGMLVAVVFLGQFRTGPDQLRSSAIDSIGEAEIERFRALLISLRSYLLGVLRTLDDQRAAPTRGRRGAIEGYIQENLQRGPTLAGLASRLSLSPSRASHVVREQTGRSFRDIVEEQRMVVAKDLLSGSDWPVNWVARQVGVSDVTYFCRYFKRKTGITATTFRKQYRRVTAV